MQAWAAKRVIGEMHALRPVIGLLAVLALATVGCGEKSSEHGGKRRLPMKPPSFAHKGYIVPTRLTKYLEPGSVAGLGAVLINGYGDTLYAFTADEKHSVTCRGACRTMWHPLQLTPAMTLDSRPSIDVALIKFLLTPRYNRVVTFAGWPLYSYSGDKHPGTANGQGIEAYGGHWYAVTPAGALMTKHG